MPLYELVLRYPDRDEVRLTDVPPDVGETLRIAGELWTVRLASDPSNARATKRFLFELALDEAERSDRLRAWNEELEARLSSMQVAIDEITPPY
jgi:hypothetical protein